MNITPQIQRAVDGFAAACRRCEDAYAACVAHHAPTDGRIAMTHPAYSYSRAYRRAWAARAEARQALICLIEAAALCEQQGKAA